MTDGTSTTGAATELAVAKLRGAFSGREASAIEAALAALEQLEPNHPEVHLARAYLLENQGRRVEAGAARIRGYERALDTRGDPTARRLLDGMLKTALAERRGLAMVRPTAQLSSNAAVLETFVRLACNEGHFEEAEGALERLAPLKRDLVEAVALGRRFDTLVAFAQDGAVTFDSTLVEQEAVHHSLVTQALIGAAVRRSRLTDAFGRSLHQALRMLGLWSDAAARGSMRHLTTLGHDACAEAFFDSAGPSLSRLAAIEILDEALISCLRRGAFAAFSRYAERLDKVSGCRLAGLTRLASQVGVKAGRSPPWAALLDRLYEDAAARAETVEASVRGIPRKSGHTIQPLAAPTEGRIDVFLKCVRRPFDIRPFVTFWLECFADTSRYRVRLLDDSGLDLKGAYAQYPIHDSRSLREGPTPALDLIRNGRTPLDMLGWESVANLTPFFETSSKWFWNIDADDIRPLLTPGMSVETVRRRIKLVETHALRSNLLALSYDLWASAHYLLDHGYHWTFGLCLCRSAPSLLDAIISSMGNVDIPSFKINIDHLLSRASDGYVGNREFTDLFSSFVFDGVSILQLDVNGREIYHSCSGLMKTVSYQRGSNMGFTSRLNEKTVVI
jgi:hypothetical protein